MSRGAQEVFMWLIIIVLCCLVGGGIIGGCSYVVPNYNVWQQEMAGRARLAEATSSRKIAIEEAKAKEEAAKSLSNAEVERARGVAEANRIIGDSLKNNEGYLRWLWIDKIASGENREVYYIPTEANIPITESGRASVGRLPKHPSGQ
jgi:hypothetical protein